MAKRITYTIGPVSADASTKTEARDLAESAARKALAYLDRATPCLCEWRGMVSIVSPTILPDGSIVWKYTNPRTVRELANDCGSERMGTGGYWDNCSDAVSACMSHMIQIDPAGIPDDIEELALLSPKDQDNLKTLRRYQHEPIVNPALVA